MKNAVCIVTGSSSGLGKGTALKLASKGAKLVLLSRDNQRGHVAHKEITEAGGDAQVDWIPTDLSSLESVRSFVQAFRQRYAHLDALFNCAGALLPKREMTADGLEGNFAINYLGPFLLTNLLLEPLKTAPKSRVVTISGRAHKRHWLEGLNLGTIDFEDLQGLAAFRFEKAAKQAVLAKILMTYEMSRRWKNTGIDVCTFCPGLTRTDLFSSMPWILRSLMKIRFAFPGARNPDQAAEQIVFLAKPNHDVNGKYFEFKRKQIVEARSSPESYDPNIASRLWSVSEELVGQKFSAVL